MVPEGLTLMHIRDVHLDDRELAGVQGVENGNRRVREGSRIDNDPNRLLTGLMDPIDDLILGIALMKLDLQTEFLRNPSAIGLDIGEGFISVDRRLALSQKVQVGA